MPLTGSIGGGELSPGLGKSGDVSLGRGIFGVIAGSRVCDKRYTLRNDLNKADEYVQNVQNCPIVVLQESFDAERFRRLWRLSRIMRQS
jgi:hypothetical protein